MSVAPLPVRSVGADASAAARGPLTGVSVVGDALVPYPARRRLRRLRPPRRTGYLHRDLRPRSRWRCPVFAVALALLLVGGVLSAAAPVPPAGPGGADRFVRPWSTLFGERARPVLVYATLVALPCGLYLGFVHTDWSLGYSFDARHVSTLLRCLLAAIAPLAVIAGYAGGRVLRARRGGRGLAVSLVAVSVALVATIAIAGGRLLRVGDYAAFRRGDAVPLAGTRLSYALLVLLAAIVAGAWFAARALREPPLRREIRRPPGPPEPPPAAGPTVEGAP